MLTSRYGFYALPPTLRNPSDCSPSLSLGSLNRVYLVRATLSPKFLASIGTSDILETLSAHYGLKNENKNRRK